MSVGTTIKPLTGRHMALMFTAFFGVIFAVNIFMAVVAYRSWTGLVVENSYVASQTFNTDVAALKKSEALGISHRLHYEKGNLFLSLQGADNKPMNADKVQIVIGRPVDDGQDQKLTALRTADGQFEVATKLGNGAWSGELSAMVGGNSLWRQPFKLIVSGE